MDIFERPYYRLNNRLLTLVGLWPYQDGKTRLFRSYFVRAVVLILLSTVLLELCTFYNDAEVMIEAATIAIVIINICMKYYTYHTDNMVDDWRTWTTKEEIEILETYAKKGRFYSVLYATYLYITASLYILLPLISPVMDVIAPLNESRPMDLPIMAQYFIDQEKHYTLIYFHMSFSIFLGMTVFIATDTQFFVFTCHLCGVFSIIGYRLERLLQDESTTDQQEDWFQYVILSIKGHKRAIEFAKIMESSFSYPWLVQCGMNVIDLSITQYRIMELLSFSAEMIKYIAFLIAQLFHIFCLAYFGQQIIDHSSETFFKAYSGPWYDRPIPISKLLLVVMKNSYKPIRLTAGKIFIFSLEGFATIVQTSTSYFMALLSFLEMCTCNGDLDIIMDVGTIFLTTISILTKYYTCQIRRLNMRTLLDSMIIDWRMWNTKEEIEILEEYAKRGHFYSVTYTAYIYTVVLVFVSMPFMSPLMDIIAPLNESRPMELPIMAQYFVNQDEHYAFLYVHMTFTMFLGVTVLTAADSQFFVLTCHLCRHKRAIKFAKLMESSFSYPLLVQCGLIIMALSISLYRMSSLLSVSADLIKYISFLIGQLFHVFCIAYFGQQVIDHSGDIFAKAGPWYNKPMRIRKLLILVMRSSYNPDKLTAGKIFIFSLEGFATIMQTSTSYFMMLSSVR
ncbi:hypothetical protein KPH14_003013 [Odynerus spinipes]|uniref:Odorant receptor n=1 Tax=Odynerus spinipes TaxID=1348599 RepID=A0AAD9RWR1_9HYME|nr:hypothetical protein KPH14_003013 [Odynerus spinipes]